VAVVTAAVAVVTAEAAVTVTVMVNKTVPPQRGPAQVVMVIRSGIPAVLVCVG
jgi:hypothetical protein